jgi:hypothetical protein
VLLLRGNGQISAEKKKNITQKKEKKNNKKKSADLKFRRYSPLCVLLAALL